MPQITLRLEGQVQGVGFRHAARIKAEALGLTGFARNEPDGSVYLEAAGAAAALGSFQNWCRRWPGVAVAGETQSDTSALVGFPDFKIF